MTHLLDVTGHIHEQNIQLPLANNHSPAHRKQIEMNCGYLQLSYSPSKLSDLNFKSPRVLIQTLYLMQQQSSSYGLPSEVPRGVIIPNLSDMPSEISYFFVLQREPPKIVRRNEVPYVLTYTGDPTLEDLMVRYRQDTGFAPPNATRYYFTLTSKLTLDSNFTIRDLKKMLARDSLDGIFLYPEFTTDNPDEEDEYDDESCVIDYFSKEKEYGRRKTFWLRFEVSLEGCPNKEVLYLQSNPYQSKEPLLNRLLAEVSQQFGLKDLNIKRVSEASYISQAGAKAQKLKDEKFVRQKLYNLSTVIVHLSNPKKEQFQRINAPKYNSWMVIYKQNETEPIRVKYDDIANLTVTDLYRSCLQLKESERRRDVVYCLKIMDQILTPEERVNSAEIYFKNKDANKPLNVVAKVVTEKMIFYKAIPALAAQKKAEFKLSEITIPSNQQKRREECERTVRLRAEKAPHQYFKVAENVQPIVIYTSELMYVDKEVRQELVIYQSLNKFLRETPILSLQEQAFQREWRLRYASTLLKHLEKTRPFAGETWRGISYDPCLGQKDVGAVLTFKQFTSTSNIQQVAVSFAKKYSAKQPYHLFAFKVKTGRSIIEYSLYCEGEILLEPYTEFELTAITTPKIDGLQFKVYHLEERVTSKLLPGIKANFVIWIDANPKEGKELFNRVKLPDQTTVLEQLKSTAELQQWLGRHSDLFSDKSANLLFLTNMSRPEQKGFNEYAGVDAAKLIRQHSKEVPIFFYIGDVQTAMNKLADKKMNLYKIFVGNSPKEVLAFLDKNIAASVI